MPRCPITLVAAAVKLLAQKGCTITALSWRIFSAAAIAVARSLGSRMAWALSTASDFRVPGAEVNGKPYTHEPTEQSEYMDRVLALATEDADLALKYMETALLMRGREWTRDEDLRAKVKADWDRLGSVVREP